MPTTTVSTTLLESVNIVLANLGESPVNSLSGGALPQQVSLALNTIEEVSTDIQSKGWWFNQQTASVYDETADIVIHPSATANVWSSDIPEEARRYITIRASRIAQTRLIGSEELQKFSYNEELVSLAILQQAHVRNSNGVLDFTAFPVELRSLGMDEVMFLQGNVEEKIGTLRLGGEIANIAKTKAETELVADQEALVEQQLSTEVEETAKRTAEKDLLLAQELKVDAETDLLADQEALVEQQLSTEVEETAKRTAEKDLLLAQELKVDAETDLLADQEALVEQQLSTEVEETAKRTAEKDLLLAQELKVDAETGLVSAQTTTEASQASMLDAQASNLGADSTLKGKQGDLVDAQATTEASQASMLDAQATNLGADSNLKGKQGSLVDAQATTEASQASMLDAQATNLGADTSLKGAQTTTEASQQAVLGAQATNIGADTSLKGAQTTTEASQASMLDAQASNLGADSTLKGKQGDLVDAQTTTEASQAAMLDAQAANLGADSTLKGAQTTTEASQATMLDAQAANLDADASLKGAQTTTEASQAGMLDAQSANLDADATLKGAQATTEASQSALLDAQELKTDEETKLITAQELKTDAESALVANQSSLVVSQKTQLDAQTAIEAQAEKAFYDGVVAGSQPTYRDFAAELRIMGVQESMFQQTPAVKKVELLSDASKLRLATATETGTDATELLEVNKVMRFIGESPVAALDDNALSSECVRLLRDTDTELQGRGWYFNIEEVDDEEVIVPKTLSETPQKYREYLNVRVAILLTELYPQSGVDIQRLPKMELELRAYFKDREFDDASYSVFDNYDAASRIGINRNYNLF